MSGVANFLQRQGYAALLFLFFVVVYLVPLDNRSLVIPDEVRYAEISREMLHSGDWVVPQLLGMDYFEKPVAGYWLNNISQLLFGETRFAVRFATAFCTGMTAILLYWFTLRLFYSQKKAFAVAACYLSCLEVYAIGVFSLLDGLFTLWFNLCVVFFYVGVHAEALRKKQFFYALTGVAAGLAFLTKGFIGLVVPVIVAFPYLIYSRQLAELRHLWIAILSALIVSLPWAILVHLRAPDYWHYFFWEEHIKRFSSDQAQHKAPLFYYMPVLVLGLLPWVGLVPAVLVQAWRNTASRSSIVFIFLWALLPLLFFSAAKGKLPTYILMCFAPMAILIGCGIVDFIETKKWRVIRTNAVVNLLFGLLVALTVFLIANGYLGNNAYYDDTESFKILIAIGIFIFWALMGLICFFRPSQSILTCMLCPLAFALLLNPACPRAAIYSKQPESFINEHKTLLEKARILISDDPGLAMSLAWVLKRTDIRIYGASGELTYGLKSSKIASRLILAEEFPRWLAEARQKEDVIVVAYRNKKILSEVLQGADKVYSKYSLTLFYFKSSGSSTPNE